MSKESLLLYNLLKTLRFECCIESDEPLYKRIKKVVEECDNEWGEENE